MEALSENPSRGIVSVDLQVGYYSDFIGSLTLYYNSQSTHIVVIGVLHQAMDPTKHIID